MDPVRPVLDGDDDPGGLRAPGKDLQLEPPPKTRHIGQARAVGEVYGVDLPFPVFVPARDHRPDGRRLDFGPRAVDQLHHRPIQAHLLDGRPLRRRWARSLQPRHLLVLDGREGRASRFGLATQRVVAQPDPPERRNFLGRLSERHLGPLPRRRFQEARTQAAGQ